MEDIAAGFGRERLHEQPAGGRIAGRHQIGHRREIAARLVLAPGLFPGGQLLELEGVVAAFAMTDVAARVAGAFLEKHRLDARLEEVIVQARRGLRGRTRYARAINGGDDSDDTCQTIPHGHSPDCRTIVSDPGEVVLPPSSCGGRVAAVSKDGGAGASPFETAHPSRPLPTWVAPPQGEEIALAQRRAAIDCESVVKQR